MKEPDWASAVWAELDAMDPLDRITVSGDWIIYITRVLSSSLGDYRRKAVADFVDQEGRDPQQLAETIGSRVSAVARLAQDGRKLREEN